MGNKSKLIQPDGSGMFADLYSAKKFIRFYIFCRGSVLKVMNAGQIKTKLTWVVTAYYTTNDYFPFNIRR